jgi:CRP/FNR family transcriptional regulator, cyclic AMP receptor protein
VTGIGGVVYARGERASVNGLRDPGRTRLLGGRLSGEDRDALLAAGCLMRVGSRQPLLRGQEDRVLLVQRGAAKAWLVTDGGDQVITGIVGPGHTAGLLGVLGYTETGQNVTSLEPVDALSVTGADLRHLIATRARITAACLQTVAEQHATANAERRRFAGTSVSQRVAQRLLELVTHWGQPDDGAIRIDLHLSQQELAAWSGTSRESVAKVLKRMRANGLVATDWRTLHVLDLPRLREHCERSAPGGSSEARASRPRSVPVSAPAFEGGSRQPAVGCVDPPSSATTAPVGGTAAGLLDVGQ